MKKKTLMIYVAVCLLVTSMMVGIAVIPSVLAKPDRTDNDHQHAHTIFVENIVEGDKAYKIKKCSCNDTTKVEMSNYVVATTETAQIVLDTVENGKTIVLASGEFGNLYFRKNNSSVNVQSDWAGGGPYTFKREVKDITILGTVGTVVSSIEAEAGTYTPTVNNNHSLAGVVSYLNMYITFENLTIKNITFEPEGNKEAVRLANAGQKVSIDGLTIEGCTVNGTGTIDGGNRLIISDAQEATVYTSLGEQVFVANRKNISVVNCVMNNLHQGIKINYVENLIVMGNQFNSIKGRDMLIGGGTGLISGNIYISNNTSNGATERFIRMTNLSGNLNVLNNVIVNYYGADMDIVKITSKTGSTINFAGNSWEGKNDDTAIAYGVVNY